MSKVITRLNTKGVRDPETGCLRWTAAKTPTGYGRQWDGERVQQVHRLAYEAWVGPIPAGMEIDHVYERGCRYRDCYEPSHLEPVTHEENLARANRHGTPHWSGTSRFKSHWSGASRAKSHCHKGHEMTEENTRLYKKSNGYVGRECRACKSAHNKSRYMQ